MKSKIVEFIVKIGDNIFVPNNYFWAKTENHLVKNLVLIGTVAKGILKDGNEVLLQSTRKNKSILSRISRLELDRKEITEASEGQEIGMCLPGITAKQLKPIRRTKKSRLGS